MALANRGRKPRNPRGKPWFPHASGYWAAMIGGKMVYFGRWGTRQAEVEKAYLKAKREHLDQVGKAPPRKITDAADATFGELIGGWLDVQQAKFEQHKIAVATRNFYRDIVKIIPERVRALQVGSLGPADFAALSEHVVKTGSIKRRDHLVRTVRQVFKWAVTEGHLARPPSFGTSFSLSVARERAADRAAKPLKLFTAGEVHKLLDAADETTTAQILLALNLGYSQADLAELAIDMLPPNQIDLDSDPPSIRFDRVKTGQRRRGVLWPETAQALREVIGDRQEGNVFLTTHGEKLVHFSEENQARCDSVGIKFRRLKAKAGVANPAAFGSFRHTAITVVLNEGRDLSAAAIHWTFGHTMGGATFSRMLDHYLEEVPIGPLKQVADVIRKWLWPGRTSGGPPRQTG